MEALLGPGATVGITELPKPVENNSCKDNPGQEQSLFESERIAVESNQMGAYGARMVEIRSYAADANAMQLAKQLAAVSRRLVDTPDDWDLFNRVPDDQRSAHPLTNLFATLKDNALLMRRYAIAMIKNAAQLQIKSINVHSALKIDLEKYKLVDTSGGLTSEFNESMIPILKDVKVETKVAMYARTRAKHALDEARRAVAVAEKIYVLMHFMSKLISALDHLAHGDEYCDNLSSSYSHQHSVHMYTASVRQTYLTETQRKHLEFLEEMMKHPSAISAKRLREYTQEYEELEAMCSPDFASLPPKDIKSDLEMANDINADLEMAKRMRHLHLNWAAGYFEEKAAEDRWKFMRVLKDKMGKDCLGYASDFKEMTTPNSGQVRACMDAFWEGTLLGKQNQPAIWYSGKRQDINEMLDSDLLPVAQDVVSLLEERALELNNWKPDLVRYAKTRVDV